MNVGRRLGSICRWMCWTADGGAWGRIRGWDWPRLREPLMEASDGYLRWLCHKRKRRGVSVTTMAKLFKKHGRLNGFFLKGKSKHHDL